MRFRLYAFIPAALVVLCAVLVLQLGSELARWESRAHKVMLFPPFDVLACLPFVLAMVAALCFQMSRMVLIPGAFAAAHLLASGAVAGLSPAARSLLIPVVAVEAVVLVYLRERGMFNRFGMLRALCSAMPFAALLYGGERHALGGAVLGLNPGWMGRSPGGMETSYGALMAAAAALILVLRQRRSERAVVGPSVASALAATVLGLDRSLWPHASASVAGSLFFFTAGLAFAWCVFLLAWGRAYRDDLTGLPGRRALDERLAGLSGAYALVMVDVDHFKRFNDRYGHDTGDDVLRLVASVLRRHGPGTAYRYGGEEFALVCPGRGAKELAPRLEKLRGRIASTRLTLRRNPGKNGGRTSRRRAVSVTASYGLAETNDRHPAPAEVLAAADRALYRAKKAGRNRVKVA